MNPTSPLLDSSPDEDFKSFANSGNPSFFQEKFIGNLKEKEKNLIFFSMSKDLEEKPKPFLENPNEKSQAKNDLFKNDLFVEKPPEKPAFFNEMPSFNKQETVELEENHDLQLLDEKSLEKTVSIETFLTNYKRISLINLVILLTIGLFPLISSFKRNSGLYIENSEILEKQAFFNVISGVLLIFLMLLFRIEDLNSPIGLKTGVLIENLPNYEEKLEDKLWDFIKEKGFEVKEASLVFDCREIIENMENSLNKTNNISKMKISIEEKREKFMNKAFIRLENAKGSLFYK